MDYHEFEQVKRAMEEMLRGDEPGLDATGTLTAEQLKQLMTERRYDEIIAANAEGRILTTEGENE